MEKVTQRIIQFNKNRLPDIVQLKYKAMAENIFRFYRGSNHLFYEDLSHFAGLPDSPLTWVCGDLHLENFGSFKSDNRLVYFDLNDFDEAVLAPALYEVARLLTSILIAFEFLKIDQKKALNMVKLFLKNYCTTLSKGKPWYIEPQTANGIVGDFLNSVKTRKTKDILKRKAKLVDNKWELKIDNDKHFEMDKKLKKQLVIHIKNWLKNDGSSPYNYSVEDVVHRFAGTGSLGLKRYVFLLKSLNTTGEKYLLIDMKQSTSSALLSFVKIPQPKWKNEAERIIAIQQRMQNRPPALLSASIFDGQPYVIQEMQPTKDSLNFKLLAKDYRDLCHVIDDMAVLTASSQLRSAGRQQSAVVDALITFGESNKWQHDIINYSINYAQQVKTDYLHFINDLKGNKLNDKV